MKLPNSQKDSLISPRLLLHLSLCHTKAAQSGGIKTTYNTKWQMLQYNTGGTYNKITKQGGTLSKLGQRPWLENSDWQGHSKVNCIRLYGQSTMQCCSLAPQIHRETRCSFLPLKELRIQRTIQYVFGNEIMRVAFLKKAESCWKAVED